MHSPRHKLAPFKMNTPEMENALEQKKYKILRRLENTIEASNCVLYEINQELEGILENNRVLEKTAEIYEIWCNKGA